MAGDDGASAGRPRLVPELVVSDLARSLAFWCGLIGFRIRYDRPEERFAFVELDGAEVMLEERDPAGRQWLSAPFALPQEPVNRLTLPSWRVSATA